MMLRAEGEEGTCSQLRTTPAGRTAVTKFSFGLYRGQLFVPALAGSSRKAGRVCGGIACAGGYAGPRCSIVQRGPKQPVAGVLLPAAVVPAPAEVCAPGSPLDAPFLLPRHSRPGSARFPPIHRSSRNLPEVTRLASRDRCNGTRTCISCTGSATAPWFGSPGVRRSTLTTVRFGCP